MHYGVHMAKLYQETVRLSDDGVEIVQTVNGRIVLESKPIDARHIIEIRRAAINTIRACDEALGYKTTIKRVV